MRPWTPPERAAVRLISRHPFKAQFELKYGSEFNILALMKVKLRVYDEALYDVVEKT